MGRVGNRRPSGPSACPAWAAVTGGSSNLGPYTPPPPSVVALTADPSPVVLGVDCEALVGGGGAAQTWTGSQGLGVSIPCLLPWA